MSTAYIVPLDSTRQQHTISDFSKAVRREQRSPAVGVVCFDHSTTTAYMLYNTLTCYCVIHVIHGQKKTFLNITEIKLALVV